MSRGRLTGCHTGRCCRYETASLVGGKFREALSRALVATQRRWAAHLAADEADRLTPIVESLSSRCGRHLTRSSAQGQGCPAAPSTTEVSKCQVTAPMNPTAAETDAFARGAAAHARSPSATSECI